MRACLRALKLAHKAIFKKTGYGALQHNVHSSPDRNGRNNVKKHANHHILDADSLQRCRNHGLDERMEKIKGIRSIA